MKNEACHNGHNPGREAEVKKFMKAEGDHLRAKQQAEEKAAAAAKAAIESRKAREAEEEALAKRNAVPNPLNKAFVEPVPEEPLFQILLAGVPHGDKCRRFIEAVDALDWADDPEGSIAAFFQQLKSADLAPSMRIQRRAGGQMATGLDVLSHLLKTKALVDLQDKAVYVEWSPVVKDAAEDAFGPNWLTLDTPLVNDNYSFRIATIRYCRWSGINSSLPWPLARE